MNGPKQKLVSVDEVSVSTLSVEIKTISVGRRQMSMALFRQLPRESLIDLDDKDLRLNGMPWGRVNYHWDGCHQHTYLDEMSTHIHVLWQRDNTLIQSAVSAKHRFVDKEGELNDLRDRYQALSRIGALLCALATTEEVKVAGHVCKIGRWEATDVPNAYGMTCANLISSFRQAPDNSAGSYGSRSYWRAEIEKRITELCGSIGLLPEDEDDAWDVLNDWREEGKELRTAHQRILALYETRYNELLALEQLFISA